MGRRRATGSARQHEPQGVAMLAVSLPAPHEAFSDNPVLMEDERRDLIAAERAVDHLRLAFWAAGKALARIQSGRLYRETHQTFEAYLSDRWDMSLSQAHRLIQAWPLAEAIGVSPIGETKLTESQVRALLPVARKHGEDVAARVYQAVAETEGVRVTAALLADAGRALPDVGAQLGAEQVAEAVRVFLAGQRDGGSDDAGSGESGGQSAGAELAAEIERMHAILRRMESRGLVASDDAKAVRDRLAALRLPEAPDGEAAEAGADPNRVRRYRVHLGCGDTIGRDYPPMDPTTTCPTHGRQEVLSHEDTGLAVQ
jgi:hypothetical protein